MHSAASQSLDMPSPGRYLVAGLTTRAQQLPEPPEAQQVPAERSSLASRRPLLRLVESGLSLPAAGSSDAASQLPADLPALLRQRRPDIIRRLLPFFRLVGERYFRARVEGLENLSSGRSLVACTHNGGMLAPDLVVLLTAFWQRFGPEAPLFALAHSLAFKLPFYGRLLSWGGGVPASTANARLVLEHGFPAIVCPGGDVDSLKPFSMRHRVLFDGRRGFLRLALREQVPVVPVVSVGAHETLLVLNDGQRLAELLCLDHLFRVKCAPLTLSFPLGLGIGGVPFNIPLPAQITIRVLPPIRFALPPSAADDPVAVEKACAHVKTRMQEALDDLASRRRRPFFG